MTAGTRNIATTSSTYSTTSVFKAADLANDFDNSGYSRWIEFEKVKLTFNPFVTTTLIGGVSETLQYQLLVSDPVTGRFAPATGLKYMSSNVATSLSLTISSNLRHWYSASDTTPIFAVAIYNSAGSSSNSFTVGCRIDTTLKLASDVPNGI